MGRKYSVVSWICSGFADGDVAIAAPDPCPPRTDHPATHRRPPCQEQTIVVRGRNRDRPPSPDVDSVRPGMCPCCGRAGNPTGSSSGSSATVCASDSSAGRWWRAARRRW